MCTWDSLAAFRGIALAVSAGRGGGLNLDDDFTYFSVNVGAILDSGDRIVTPTSVMVLQPLITHTKWY